MDIDINAISSGLTRAGLFSDFMFEAINEDRISSVNREQFDYYIRAYKEAREQNLPREPEKQYQVLLQLQVDHGFSVQEGLANLKPGSKVLITVHDNDLFDDSYNLSIQQRNAMLGSLDPVKRDARNKEFNDMIENATKKANQLKLFLGKEPRVVYKNKDCPLKPGTKRRAVLEYLRQRKNVSLDVRDFKKVVNEQITNGHKIKGFGDVDDMVRVLRKSLKVKKDDYFPITTDGYVQTITWIDPK